MSRRFPRIARRFSYTYLSFFHALLCPPVLLYALPTPPAAFPASTNISAQPSGYDAPLTSTYAKAPALTVCRGGGFVFESYAGAGTVQSDRVGIGCLEAIP